MNDEQGGPIKNSETQMPVAPIWRPTFEAIVAAFVAGDWELRTAPAEVQRVPARLARVLQDNVVAYGSVTLVPLPKLAWDSSVAMWTGQKWEVLVDLWTEEEGRSDLVLDAFVTETETETEADGFVFEVHLVYVP
jgi:hypothetical protein